MPSSHLILCRPLLLLPPIPPSIRASSNESALRMRWPKYWSFSFSSIPSKEIPGLISFRMDWLDLLAVQGTLKSLLQHHSSKASILWRSAFFTVQLSHPYMTTGKTIALTRRTLETPLPSFPGLGDKLSGEEGPSWDSAPGLASGRAPGKRPDQQAACWKMQNCAQLGLEEATWGPRFGLKNKHVKAEQQLQARVPVLPT